MAFCRFKNGEEKDIKLEKNSKNTAALADLVQDFFQQLRGVLAFPAIWEVQEIWEFGTGKSNLVSHEILIGLVRVRTRSHTSYNLSPIA